MTSTEAIIGFMIAGVVVLLINGGILFAVRLWPRNETPQEQWEREWNEIEKEFTK